MRAAAPQTLGSGSHNLHPVADSDDTLFVQLRYQILTPANAGSYLQFIVMTTFTHSHGLTRERTLGCTQRRQDVRREEAALKRRSSTSSAARSSSRARTRPSGTPRSPTTVQREDATLGIEACSGSLASAGTSISSTCATHPGVFNTFSRSLVPFSLDTQ